MICRCSLFPAGEADGAVNALPEPTQYLLTVSELITTPLTAKLVVISGGHRTESPRVTAKGLMCMAQALLAAGAECVLIPIWPSSFQASRLMMNAFYSSLIYGSKASRALRYAMQVHVYKAIENSVTYDISSKKFGPLIIQQPLLYYGK